MGVYTGFNLPVKWKIGFERLSLHPCRVAYCMTEDDLPNDVKLLLAKFRMVSNILLEVGKVAGVISIPASTWLFAQYLSAVSAPFAVAASTLPTLFGVLMVMIVFVALTLAGSMLWVVRQVKPFPSARLRREFPHLKSHAIPFRQSKPKPSPRDPVTERKMRRRRRRFANSAFRDYCFVYAPFIAVWLFNALGATSGWHPSGPTFLLVMLACFLLGGGISAGVFYFWRSNLPIDSSEEARSVRTSKFVLRAFPNPLLLCCRSFRFSL
jgi:hypothetical protein